MQYGTLDLPFSASNLQEFTIFINYYTNLKKLDQQTLKERVSAEALFLSICNALSQFSDFKFKKIRNSQNLPIFIFSKL